MFPSSDPNVLYTGTKYANNQFGNFSQSTYQYNGSNNIKNSQTFPIIEKQSFSNKNNTLHNNLGDNIKYERISEYKIDIDSNDRNISTYINPFRYNVTFSPITKSSSSTEEWIDINNKSLGKHMVNTIYNGSVAPFITKSFKNIKYLKLDYVQLPKYYKYVFDSSSSTWKLDTTKSLLNERYVVLKINNLDSKFNLSTTPISDTNGIKLIPDTFVGDSNFYYAVPMNNSGILKSYNLSSLGNLDKLEISFYDCSGNILDYKNYDAGSDISDIRNPNNANIQHNICITLGVLENELCTEPSFY